MEGRERGREKVERAVWENGRERILVGSLCMRCVANRAKIGKWRIHEKRKKKKKRERERKAKRRT